VFLVDPTERKGKKTIATDYDPDFLEDLSEYLEVLGHPQRLKILKAIETEPKDIRTIAAETGSTYENTKKHLYRLIGTSLVRREAGFGQPTAKGILPVWKFSLAPGAMDTILRDLSVFSSVRNAIADTATQRRLAGLSDEIARTLTGTRSALVIVSGVQDGMVFPLVRDRIAIGREEPAWAGDPEAELVLSSAYASVTRISGPHAILYREGDRWYFQDARSSGGSSVNGNALVAGQPKVIRNGDVIELGRGQQTAVITLVNFPEA
jgi:hypothetical protein